MTRQYRYTSCHADYQPAHSAISVSVSGSYKWVVRQFPKLVAMARRLE